MKTKDIIYTAIICISIITLIVTIVKGSKLGNGDQFVDNGGGKYVIIGVIAVVIAIVFSLLWIF